MCFALGLKFRPGFRRPQRERNGLVRLNPTDLDLSPQSNDWGS